MNKKFINLLLASVLTVGSAQVFTSCKDNEADLRKEIQYDYESLEARVANDEQKLADLSKDLNAFKVKIIDDLNAAKSELMSQLNQFNEKFDKAVYDLGQDISNVDKKLADYIVKNDAELVNLQNQITANFNKIANLQADLAIITNRVAALEAAKLEIENRLNGLDATVANHAERIILLEEALQLTKADLAQLSSEFNAYKGATDLRIDALEAFKNDWEALLPTIQQNAADALALAQANKESIDAINELLEEIQDQIGTLNGQYEAQQLLIEDIQEKLLSYVTSEDFNAAFNGLDGRVETLEDAIEDLKRKDNELQLLAASYYSQSVAYTNQAIQQALSGMMSQSDIESLVTTTVSQLTQGIENKISDNAGEITNLQDKIDDELMPKLTSINEAVSALTDRVAEIDGRITSIVLQGTEDDVFGSLRLPIGIQSNLLIAYFGDALNDVDFPLVADGAGTYDGDISNSLTQAEADRLGVGYGAGYDVEIETVSGYYMNESNPGSGKGYLGQVYATFNPSSVDVQNEKFEYHLVNSRGERVAEPLKFVPSDKVLEFGYGRGGKDNGFYSAEASIDVNEAALNRIRFSIDNNLKSTVKDILSAPRSSANTQTVLKLANAIYNQLNGFLPAIGVEASWSDSKNGQMKVTSNYGIATAVVNPLSFKFLYGINPGKHIPTLMPQLDKIKDKFEVIFNEFEQKLTIKLYDPENPFTIGNVTLEAPEITIDLDPSSVNITPVVIDVPEIWVDMPVEVDEETGEMITEPTKVFDGYHDVIDMSEDLQQIIEDLQTNLENSMSGLTDSFDSINAQLKKLTTDIAQQVNDLLSSMQETVDSTIDDLLSDIKDKVNGALDNARLNSLINRIDGIIGRLNEVIDNANFYLQPILMYNNNGSFGMISSNVAMPSVMVLKDGGNAINLVPTTLTYETVVPVCKKYVAVTRVWANGDASKTNNAQLAQTINASNYMNMVARGGLRQIPLRLEKGYTYEVFYQALDYCGYVSGRKYYICVK